MRALQVGLVLPCLVAASGCGTVGNVCLRANNPHIYGGVELDYQELKASWFPTDQALDEHGWFPAPEKDKAEARRPLNRVCETIFGTALVTLDFPLSLVGDTITLPGILLTSGHLGWDLGRNPPPTLPGSRPPEPATEKLLDTAR